jgi:Secreted repeat of unknown function
MFVPDKRKKVTCVSNCARIWPPVKLPAGAKITAADGVKTKLLKSDKDPAGGRVVTYNGWPLYTYAGDRKPGTATGQALNLNGGLWYVIATTGKVIKTKPSSAASNANSGQQATTPTTTTAPTTMNPTTTTTATTPTTTSPATTTTTTSPPGNFGCPAGETVYKNGGDDGDNDNESPQINDDGDGCI